MPNLYLKINEKFTISNSTEPNEADRPPPIFPAFHNGNFIDISISTIPSKGSNSVGFIFSLSQKDISAGEFKINDLKNSLEVIIDAIFNVPVKPIAVEDILNPEVRWSFNGLEQPGTWNSIKGDIIGLPIDEYTQGQGEWKRTFTRYLIGVTAAKTLKGLK